MSPVIPQGPFFGEEVVRPCLVEKKCDRFARSNSWLAEWKSTTS